MVEETSGDQIPRERNRSAERVHGGGGVACAPGRKKGVRRRERTPRERGGSVEVVRASAALGRRKAGSRPGPGPRPAILHKDNPGSHLKTRANGSRRDERASEGGTLCRQSAPIAGRDWEEGRGVVGLGWMPSTVLRRERALPSARARSRAPRGADRNRGAHGRGLRRSDRG